MDFHPVGLMSIIRGFAKLRYDPGQSFLKVGKVKGDGKRTLDSD